jgi:hypothetical protein
VQKRLSRVTRAKVIEQEPRVVRVTAAEVKAAEALPAGGRRKIVELTGNYPLPVRARFPVVGLLLRVSVTGQLTENRICRYFVASYLIDRAGRCCPIAAQAQCQASVEATEMPLCSEFERRERRDSNPRPPA